MSKKSSIVASSKQAERDVAKVYGGRRLTAGEWNGAGDIDVISDRYAIQVKHRSNVPAYILEGLDQVQEGAADIEELFRLQPGPLSFRRQPLLVIVTKPGRGKPSRMFAVKEIFDDETK